MIINFFIAFERRAILKEHRSRLPPDLRRLGDAYVRNEFQQHKKAGPDFLDIFFKSWDNYLATIRSQEKVKGENLASDEIQSLNEKQKQRLQEFKDKLLS